MANNRIKTFFNRSLKLRKYNNVIEAAYWGRIILKLSGTVIYDINTRPENVVTTSFSVFGFTNYIIMFSSYLYCSFIIHFEDQTILRQLYNTKLRRYGDDFERTTSTVFVIITMILNPLRLTRSRAFTQKIIDIDVIIEKTGDIIDYNRLAHTALSLALSQVVVYLVRLLCVYVVLNSSISMPVEKMFHVCITDSLAVVTTAMFCYVLFILIDRFKWVNKTLKDIKMRNSWEYKVFVRNKVPANMVKVMELQERQVCEKIKTCARVYGMLYDTCKSINYVYGLSLLFAMLHSFNYIILYLFYFMEATATGLFYDMSRYFEFLVYTFWEIAIASGVVFMVVVFSEITVDHARKTSFIIHEIINEDFGPLVNDEAMKFSIQLLHQIPEFKVCGLFNLDYAYLQQAARSVSTYLVILLQFVTDH